MFPDGFRALRYQQAEIPPYTICEFIVLSPDSARRHKAMVIHCCSDPYCDPYLTFISFVSLLTLFGVGSRTRTSRTLVEGSVTKLVTLAMGLGKDAQSVGWGVCLCKRLGDVDLWIGQ